MQKSTNLQQKWPFLSLCCRHSRTHVHTQETQLPLSVHRSLGMFHREAGRPHLENRRGLLLCCDGELTPEVARSSTAKSRMKEKKELPHTLQHALAKISLFFLHVSSCVAPGLPVVLGGAVLHRGV